MKTIHIGENYNGLLIKEETKLYNNTTIAYKYKCVKCGYEDVKSKSNLIKGKGCPVCSNKIIIKGYNDLSTTHPYVMKNIVNPDEAYSHSYGSHFSILTKCEICGNERRILIPNFLKYGVMCNKCGDGFSYSNKFMVNFLTQLSIPFKTEAKFDWSNNKIYDLYIGSKNLIIENHGKGHYSQYGFISVGGRSLQEEQLNDEYKKTMALKHGIKHYVILDCYESNLNYIKNSIMNSELAELLSINENNINWNECDMYASKSLFKSICEYFNNNNEMSTENIGVVFGITKQTVITYLKHGAVLGWCNYNPKEKMMSNGAKNGSNRSREILFFDKGAVYKNARILNEEYLNETGIFLEENSIRAVCRNVNKSYKGFHFGYNDKIPTMDLKVIGVEEGTSRLAGTLGALVVQYKNNTVNVGSGYDDKIRQEIWDNRENMIGKIIEVKYKEVSKDKKTGLESLQFPVFVGIRNDKNEVSYD